MALEIGFDTVRVRDSTQSLPASWQVGLSHVHGDVLVRGFGRKRDAQLAVLALQETGIDWNAEEDEVRRQWNRFGGREAVERFVYERMQW